MIIIIIIINNNNNNNYYYYYYYYYYHYYYYYYYWEEEALQVAKRDDTKNSRVWDLRFLSQIFVGKENKSCMWETWQGRTDFEQCFY